NMFRHVSAGGGQFASWGDDGALDLSYLSTGAVIFKNNVGGVRWKNSSGTAVSPLYVDSSNVVQIGAGLPVNIGSTLTGANVNVGQLGGNNDTDTFFEFAGN